MPAYGTFIVLWSSFLSSNPTGDRMLILIVVFGITCIFPMFFISGLQHFKIIKDKRLDNRKERLFPYIFTLLCYIGACLYLNNVHAPMWFIMFTGGGGLACLISLIVNLWWKISAHMAGIGGIVALIYTLHVQMLGAFNLIWLLNFTILLAGLLGTSRIVLRRHDILQVLAGAGNGYLCVKLMMTLFG